MTGGYPLHRVLTDAANHFLILAFRLSTNLRPVRFAHVVVNFDQAGIQAVAAAFFAAGDPVEFAAVHIEVVALVAVSAKRLELAPAVVEHLAGLGEGHATDARGA